jgi:hypothetical protein
LKKPKLAKPHLKNVSEVIIILIENENFRTSDAINTINLHDYSYVRAAILILKKKKILISNGRDSFVFFNTHISFSCGRRKKKI